MRARMYHRFVNLYRFVNLHFLFQKITILFYIIKHNANYTSFFCKKIWIYELFLLPLYRFLKEACKFNKCKF